MVRGLRLTRLQIAAIIFISLLWILAGVKALGVNLDLIQTIAGFLYITIIPGMLILDTLRIPDLSITEKIGYSLGLSIFVCFFSALLINLFGPLIGIDRALDYMPLLIISTITTAIFLILNLWKNSSSLYPEKPEYMDIFTPPVLLLLLIPFIGVLGALLRNYHNNNSILLVLIVVICIIVLLISINKVIPKKYYPLAVFSIAVALLYHYTLISPYLTGWDINLEYYVAQTTSINSYWNTSIGDTSYNSSLSVTLLPAVYSHFLGLDITNIYKIIFPLFYAIVPTVLYVIFKKMSDERSAFLAVFFFIAQQTFFGLMTSLIKQQIAEIFFVLIILLILSRNINNTKTAFLLLVFSASLAVSHYALSYISLFYIFLSWIILYFISAIKREKYNRLIKASYVGFLFVVIIGWYMFVGSSASFRHLIYIGDIVYSNLLNFAFFGGTELNTLKLLGLVHVSQMHDISSFYYRLTIIFIIIGTIWMLLRIRKIQWTAEYIVMSLIAVVILGMCVILPYFSSFLHVERFYHISLFFLSLIFVVGTGKIFIWLIKFIKNGISKFRKTNLNTSSGIMNGSLVPFLVTFVVIVPYFLFNVGFMYEVTSDPVPTSIPLSLERYQNSDNTNVVENFHSEYTTAYEVYGAKWLAMQTNADYSNIYADLLSYYYKLPSNALIFPCKILYSDTEGTDNSYIYLNNFNVTKSLVNIPEEHNGKTWDQSINYPLNNIQYLLQNKIYTNDGSEIYPRYYSVYDCQSGKGRTEFRPVNYHIEVTRSEWVWCMDNGDQYHNAANAHSSTSIRLGYE